MSNLPSLLESTATIANIDLQTIDVVQGEHADDAVEEKQPNDTVITTEAGGAAHTPTEAACETAAADEMESAPNENSECGTTDSTQEHVAK